MGRLRRLTRLIAGEREGRYECLNCHANLTHQRQVCPECGGYDIRRVEWLDGDTGDADGADTSRGT